MIKNWCKIENKWCGSSFFSSPSFGPLLFRNYGSTTDDIFCSPETYARGRISQNIFFLWRKKNQNKVIVCFPKPDPTMRVKDR